jgi:hypothetical protein
VSLATPRARYGTQRSDVAFRSELRVWFAVYPQPEGGHDRLDSARTTMTHDVAP